MKKFFSGFLTGLILCSRIPFPLKFKPEYSSVLFFLPVIGFLTAGVAGGTALLFTALTADPLLTAIAVLTVQYVSFNLFHFDGLMDCADAFFCFTGREKRLSIMKDHNTGSFALFTGVLYLTAKIYLIQLLLRSPLSLFIIFFYPVSGRMAGALLPALLRPVREEGLGAALENGRTAGIPGALAALAAGSALLLFSGDSFHTAFLPALLSFIPVFLFCALLSRVKIGGYTGDTIGFTVETGESVYLFSLFLGLHFIS